MGRPISGTDSLTSRLSSGVSYPALVLSVLLLLLACTSLAGQIVPPTGSIRVHLKVSADADLKGSVQNALEGELRATPGVQISDALPDFTISVIALKVFNRSRKDVGVTFSVLVTEPYGDRVQRFAESHVAPERRQELIAALAGVVKPRAHWVETAAAGDLKAVCRSIIKSFSVDVLAKRREPDLAGASSRRIE